MAQPKARSGTTPMIPMAARWRAPRQSAARAQPNPFTGYGGLIPPWTTSQNGWFEHEVRPSPEPSTDVVLLLTSALALAAWRR